MIRFQNMILLRPLGHAVVISCCMMALWHEIRELLGLVVSWPCTHSTTVFRRTGSASWSATLKLWKLLFKGCQQSVLWSKIDNMVIVAMTSFPPNRSAVASIVMWVSCDSAAASTFFQKLRRTVLRPSVLRRSVHRRTVLRRGVLYPGSMNTACC